MASLARLLCLGWHLPPCAGQGGVLVQSRQGKVSTLSSLAAPKEQLVRKKELQGSCVKHSVGEGVVGDLSS